MSWVTKKIYDFLMDLVEGLVETFADLILNMFTGMADSIINSSQVLSVVMVTTGIATALISLMAIKQLFSTYILETEGDPDSDPLQQLVKSAIAVALIQTNSVLLNALLHYASLVESEVWTASGNTSSSLTSSGIINTLSSSGVSLIVAAIFSIVFIVGLVLLAFKACLRAVELAIMQILYPIFCVDILSVQQERWKNFFVSYMVCIFGYIIQILCFILSVNFGFQMNSSALSGLGSFFIALAFLFFAVKAPNWLEKYVYSSGAGKSAAGTARSAQQILMMQRMYRR